MNTAATKNGFSKLAPVLGLVVFTLALWVLHRELQAYNLQDIMAEFGRIPAKSFWAALLLTLAGLISGGLKGTVLK